MLFTNVAGSGCLLKSSVDPVTKPEPFTVNNSGGSPTEAEFGTKLVMTWDDGSKQRSIEKAFVTVLVSANLGTGALRLAEEIVDAGAKSPLTVATPSAG